MPRPASDRDRSSGARAPRTARSPRTPEPLPRPVQLPDVHVSTTSLVDADAAAIALPVRSGDGEGPPRPGPGTADVEGAFGVNVADELALAKAKGEPGEIVEVPISDEGR